MKKLKNCIISILYIFLSTCIFNVSYSKSLDKLYNSDKFSKYFSAVLSATNNDYENSYKYLKGLKGMEGEHVNYAEIYHYTLVNLERFEEAYSYSKQLEKKGIENFESNLIIGVYYLKNKKFEKAQKYFQKLKATNQNDTLKGLLANSLSNWISYIDINEQEAIRLNDKIAERFEPIKRIQESFLYCRYDSKKTSQKYSELTSDTKNDYFRYNFFHSYYLYQYGKREEAIKIINSSLKLNPRNLILNQLRDDIEFKNKKKFNNDFDCKSISHVSAELFYITANALSSRSAHAMSNFYLNIAKYLNKDFISFQTLYAENTYNLGKPLKAKKVYESFHSKASIYKWYANKKIVNILFDLEEKNQATSFLSNTYNDIGSPNVYQIYDYAEFLKNNEEFLKSISYYTKALNLIDREHHLYSKLKEGRGVAYERTNDWNKAEKDLLNSLEVTPNQAYVMNYLAYTWIEKGVNIEQSFKMLKQANEIKKNDGYIIDSLGWAFFKLKKYDEARKYLELAVRIMPGDPIVNDHYADSLWMTKKEIQARYIWQYVLNLEKTEKDIKESIKKKLIFGLKKKT